MRPVDEDEPPVELPDEAFRPPDEAQARQPVQLAEVAPPRAKPLPRRAVVARPLPEIPLPTWKRVALATAGVLLAIPAAFLPTRWRAAWGLEHLPLAAGGVASGLIEAGLGVWLFVTGLTVAFDAYLPELVPAAVDYVLETGTWHVVAGRAVGYAVFVHFIASWAGVGCVFLVAEGLGRILCAVLGEPRGIVLLWLADRLGLVIAACKRAWRLGRIVPDVVTPSADGRGLTIESCRPRDWANVALALDGEYWRIVDHEERPAGPRRFVYRLEPLPEREIIRGVRVYDPEELVRQRGRWRREWADAFREAFSRRRRS